MLITPEAYYQVKEAIHQNRKSRRQWLCFSPDPKADHNLYAVSRFIDQSDQHMAINEKTGKPFMYDYRLTVPGTNKDREIALQYLYMYYENIHEDKHSFLSEYLTEHGDRAVECSYKSVEEHQKSFNSLVDKVMNYVDSKRGIISAIAENDMFFGVIFEPVKLGCNGLISISDSYKYSRDYRDVFSKDLAVAAAKTYAPTSVSSLIVLILTRLIGISFPWASFIAMAIVTSSSAYLKGGDIRKQLTVNSASTATSMVVKYTVKSIFTKNNLVTKFVVGTVGFVTSSVVSKITRETIGE